MKNVTLRGLDENLEKALRKRAKEKGESINKTILNILRKETGQTKDKPFKTYHDLDDLAGTWNSADFEEFAKYTEDFNRIDPDLWD